MADSGQVDIFEVNNVIDQLESKDAKVRRKAARRLGELKDPMAIQPLARVYRSDEDNNVKKAAEDALRVFRRLEAIEAGEKVRGGGGGAIGKLLTRLLTLVLLVTVIANIVLLVKRVGPTLGSASPDTQPSISRDDLTSALDQRLTDLMDETKNLRPIFTTFQGNLQTKSLPPCTKLPDTKSKQVTLTTVDQTVYPKLSNVNDLMNTATLKLNEIRTKYDALCQIRDVNRLLDTLKNEGGSAELVTLNDELSNKYINDVSYALAGAKASPDVTAVPSATPIPPTATPIPPTNTPGPTSAATKPPAVVPANGTPAAQAPTPTAPPAATGVPPTATKILPSPTPSYIYSGLGLETLKRYHYSMSVSYVGQDAKNTVLQGAFSLSVTYQGDPLIADYEITIDDLNKVFPALQILGDFPPSLYVSGPSSYIIRDGTLYQTQESVANGACKKVTVPDVLKAINPTSIRLSPDAISKIPLKQVPADKGFLSFKGTLSTPVDGGSMDQTYTLLVAGDTRLPLQISYEMTQPVSSKSSKLVLSSLKVDYNLIDKNEKVSLDTIVAPTGCGVAVASPTAGKTPTKAK